MRLVIFDVDGTLLDSAAIILKAQALTFKRCGLVHPGREAGLGVVGLTLDLALMALAGSTKPDPALADMYKTVFGELRDAAFQDPALAEKLYPGVRDMLASFADRADTKLAIATGKSRRGVDHLLRLHGWDALFSSIQTADDAPSKPHPGMILRAMKEAGAAPDETAMIGDSTFDMKMAVDAGVTAIAVAWGFQPVDRLRAAGAHHVVMSAADLPGMIEKAFPASALS
jgi:phosphoglycolate phosphatase